MQAERKRKQRHAQRATRAKHAPQLELALKPRFRHGGRRKGAGRPKTSNFQPHIARDRFHAREPLHLTLRLEDGLPSLRRKDLFKCLRHAVAKARKHELSIIHFSILSNHAHFIIESPRKEELAKQMQSLEISFAKKVNALLKRTGKVFRERYHVHILRTPQETKNALRYVLSNESKHKGLGLGTYFISPFSSGHSFREWPRLFGSKSDFEIDPGMHWSLDELERWLEEALSPARTWLLKEGWKRGHRRAVSER